MSLPLPVVDGRSIAAPQRALLLAGTIVRDSYGRQRRLPRFFYVVDTPEVALATALAPNFGLWEFIEVDVFEPLSLRTFPRYVPCAVTMLAAHLQLLRNAVGHPVKIAANGGYRSPAHARSVLGSTHAWGTAANIYRIGDDYLDTRETIERYAALAAVLLPAMNVRRYGLMAGGGDDHLHVDIGHALAVPLDAPPETTD